MKTSTILIFGAIAIVLLYLFSKSTAVTTQQTLAAQKLALNNQYDNTTAGQVGGIMASVGSFFNSGALQSLKDTFLDTGSNNEPGLISNPGSSAGLNNPGLNAPSVWSSTYGPQNEPGVTTGPQQEDYYA